MTGKRVGMPVGMAITMVMIRIRTKRRQTKRKRSRGPRREREREREREKQRKKESIGGSRVEDLRAAFETGGKKKKKTKAQVDEKIEEEKIEPSKVENAKKFDTFDDIQVNDNAPSISVNAGGSSPESKPNLFGIFTSWMGGREGNRSKDNMPKEKEQKKDLLEVNPWESDQSKSRKNDQGSHISALDIDDAKREESAVRPEKEEDNLGLGFTATSKDKKKKKKKDELLPVTTSETHTPEAVNEPVATKDNVWADSLTSGSKKSKKGVLEAKESLDNNKVEKQSRLSPEPEKTENIVGSTTTSKKDKEKKGKVSVTEAEANERQAVAKAPEVETDTIDDLGKKKKKKKSKNAEHELETEPDFEADTAIPAEIDNADEGWSSSWNTTTVKKKGKKSKGTEEMNPEAEADVPMEPEKKGEVASIWGINKKDAIAKESEHEGPDPGHKTEPVQEPDPESKTTDGKKDRKKKKKGIVEGPPKVLNPLSDPDLEREESLEGGRANASASSKEKKRKKNSILEQVALKESQAGSVSETSAHNDDDYLSIGSKDDKKHNSPDATEGFLERKQLGLSHQKHH
ncbi:uncharacterized protein GGS25DRAFT_33131 [Hypoxylon fragiforme]|uniref:uncharacterized protein n=1 Tax=Hypoxylon fragiforme TaxID=63214 RepID=UPI0020C5B75F|nr:uncharacterized protein GGS25DRAFT_33131 [Hypoxylon fragiforme]KAI2614085.1 hypothetical protein GGS25DRAFT_33131 [Hypoxylon fragiforme]